MYHYDIIRAFNGLMKNVSLYNSDMSLLRFFRNKYLSIVLCFLFLIAQALHEANLVRKFTLKVFYIAFFFKYI